MITFPPPTNVFQINLPSKPSQHFGIFSLKYTSECCLNMHCMGRWSSTEAWTTCQRLHPHLTWQLTIANISMSSGRIYAEFPLLWDLFFRGSPQVSCMFAQSLWVILCSRPAVSTGQFVCSLSPLILTLFLLSLPWWPWALREGLWNLFSLYGWSLCTPLFSAFQPVLEPYITHSPLLIEDSWRITERYILRDDQ